MKLILPQQFLQATRESIRVPNTEANRSILLAFSDSLDIYNFAKYNPREAEDYKNIFMSGGEVHYTESKATHDLLILKKESA